MSEGRDKNHEEGEGEVIESETRQQSNSLSEGRDKNHEEGEGEVIESETRQKSNSLSLPLVVWATNAVGVGILRKRASCKALVYIVTFITYASYHVSRKPFSVVKSVLHRPPIDDNGTETMGDDWPPFTGDHGKTLLGSVDYSWLFAYAIGLFFSGHIADRVDIRFFLTFGMLGSVASTLLLGVAYYANIHSIAYFIGVQIFGGIMQSSGAPAVVSLMTHWFGKHRRGLIMGAWNANIAVGSIIGTVIASFWANPTTACPDPPWGLSFVVPAMVTTVAAMIVFLFLIPDPCDIGLSPPIHHLANEEREKEEEEEEEEETKSISDENAQANTKALLLVPVTKSKPVGFLRALKIPGVVEYALAFFFNKLVTYTFLFWLPFYVTNTHRQISNRDADWLSTLFDVGGIFGTIVIGVVSDIMHARAIACVLSLLLAVPALWITRFLGGESLPGFMVLLFVCGAFINGSYGIITTAVASDLGTHRSLRENQNAKATVSAIIDGTGSLGAALGPLLIGWLTDDWGWNAAFYLLMTSCFTSALFLTRLVVMELRSLVRRLQTCSRKYSVTLAGPGEPRTEWINLKQDQVT